MIHFQIGSLTMDILKRNTILVDLFCMDQAWYGLIKLVTST